MAQRSPHSSEPSAASPRRRGRPRKDQSLPDAPRTRLLRAGVRVLTEKGFSSVGLDEILAQAEIPKGSFYNYFPSKEELGLALIDSYADYFAAKIDGWMTNEALSPLARLRGFCADAKAGMARFEYRRGCLVGNLGQEMGVLPEVFRARLVAVMEDWERRTAACLEKAKAEGEIAQDADCMLLAKNFWIGWEGAVLRAKLERRSMPLEIYETCFFASISAPLGKDGNV